MRVTTYSIRFSKFENELQNGESKSELFYFALWRVNYPLVIIDCNTIFYLTFYSL